MHRRKLSALFSILMILSSVGYHPAADAVYSMGMGYTPKYPDDFEHFDYVDPQAAQGGDLVLYGLGSFDSLNPFLLKGITAQGIGTLVFETLLEKSLDEPFSGYGLLADDMVLADDSLSVTFHLNPAARFSNGDPVTAEDVKFSFDTIISEDAHPQFRLYYRDIESANVLDRLTIRFDFKRENPELHLIIGDISIFSKKWFEGTSFKDASDVVPIASGPYIVDEYQRGKFIRYRKNPDYWARDLAVRKGMFNFETVKYTYYRDSTIALEAFKAGEFDLFFENYSKRWARSHNGPKYDSGEIVKEELPHSNNAGMQGFVFNTRRDKFQDVRVRRALTLAFDFAWSNEHLFYDQYVRCDSYFSNSELAARGIPQGEELVLLDEFRDQLPPELFTTEWQPPDTSEPGALRKNLIEARDLLREAGWYVKDGVLVNEAGEIFTIDVLLVTQGFDRIFAPYASHLKKLGIEMSYRKVDDSLYKRRSDSFDFDMLVTSFSQSVSPGNELRQKFGSEAADTDGSRNMPGIKDPVVDELIDRLVSSRSRRELVIAARALDRVLLFGEYLVPNWYIDVHRIAYRDVFERPDKLPLYYEPISLLLKTWSMDAESEFSRPATQQHEDGS